MTLEEMEAKLNYLLDRQEIYDVVANYCRATDRLDRELMLSVYHDDGIDDHTTFVGGPRDFFDWWQGKRQTSVASSHHTIGNQTVELDGDTAHVETYFIWAGTNLEGAPFSLFGGRYVDRMEKRKGKWAIASRDMITDWAAPSVNTREGASTPRGGPNPGRMEHHEMVTAAGASQASGDRSDPSYLRPLVISAERVRQYVDAKHASATL